MRFLDTQVISSFFLRTAREKFIPHALLFESNEIDLKGIAISVTHPSSLIEEAASQIVSQAGKFWLTFW